MRPILIFIILIFFTNSLFSQFSESTIKNIINNNLNKPNDNSSGYVDETKRYEGIFIIKSVDISNSYCRTSKTISINERVGIFKYNGELVVFSLKTNLVIGKIRLEYNPQGYGGSFYPSGFRRYPKSSTTPYLWEWEVSLKDARYESQDFDPNIKSEIERQSNCQACLQDLDLRNHFVCDIRVSYKLEKVYPNKNEPPTFTSTGSGVIISSEGYVITNRHVVQRDIYGWNGQSWEVVDPNINYNDNNTISTHITTRINGIEYNLFPVDLVRSPCWSQDAKYCRIKFDEDLILLKIDNPPQNIQFAVIDTSSKKLGQQVYTLGYPLSSTLGSNLVYTNGYFSAQQGNNNWESIELYNLGINPGNSGGGIFDANTGNLVGISTARLNDNAIGTKSEGIAFGTKLNHFSFIMKQNNVTYHSLVPCNGPGLGVKYYSNFNTTFYCNDVGLDLGLLDENPRILIRDSQYKPILTLENNQKSTIQIISY